MKGKTDSEFSCVVHRWGRSRITRGITAVLLLLSVVGMGLYLLVQGMVRVVAGASMLTLLAAAGGVLSNYFWLASICVGFIATLRYTVYKEISSCAVCSKVSEPPYYRNPVTAFQRYIAMVILSTLAAFLAVLVTLIPQ